MIRLMVHPDEPCTSGYPVIDVMNMLRMIFAQRILCEGA